MPMRTSGPQRRFVVAPAPAPVHATAFGAVRGPSARSERAREAAGHRGGHLEAKARIFEIKRMQDIVMAR